MGTKIFWFREGEGDHETFSFLRLATLSILTGWFLSFSHEPCQKHIWLPRNHLICQKTPSTLLLRFPSMFLIIPWRRNHQLLTSISWWFPEDWDENTQEGEQIIVWKQLSAFYSVFGVICVRFESLVKKFLQSNLVESLPWVFDDACFMFFLKSIRIPVSEVMITIGSSTLILPIT